MSAAGRAVDVATRFFTQAYSGVAAVVTGGSTTTGKEPLVSTAKFAPVSPVSRDRWNEFSMFRNAAQKALNNATSYCDQHGIHPTSMDSSRATQTASKTSSSNWFSWLLGSTSTSSSESKQREAASVIACAACGARFGPTLPRRMCQICSRVLCSGCAQQVVGVPKPGDCFVCCNDCRSQVSPKMRDALFQQSVDDALHTRFALFASDIQIQFSRATSELAKLQYLTESLTEGTADVLQTDAKQLARVASSIVTQNQSQEASLQPQQRKSRKSIDDIGNTYEAAVQQQQVATDAIARFNKMTSILRDPRSAAQFKRSEVLVAENLLLRMVNQASAWCGQLRTCTDRISTIELSTATSVYIIIFRCKLEAEDNRRFSSLFSKAIADLERTVYFELMNAAQSCSAVEWESYRDTAKDAVFKWDSVCPSIISDEPSSLLPESLRSNANSAGSEGRMMRRAIAALSKCLEHVEKRVGYGRLPKTKDSLAKTIDTIQQQFVI